MLFKLLSGVVLNVDNVLYYDPYTIRDYFVGNDGGNKVVMVDPEFDTEDLFTTPELCALENLVKERPDAAGKVVIAYAARMGDKSIVWLRKDEYQQLVGHLLSKGITVANAKQTLPDDLKGL